VGSNGTTVASRLSYDPWGKVTETGSGAVSDFTYTGHYFDRPTGLNLAQYRGYDAGLGRWLSRDPLGLQGGLNLYGYANNSPVQYVDRTGKVAVVPFIIAGVAITVFVLTMGIEAPSDTKEAPTNILGVAGAMVGLKGIPVGGGAAMCGGAAAREITADAIREMNASFGGTTELTGSADTVIMNMSYRGTATEKAATAIRDIAGRHLFDNGNKRTAQAVAEEVLGEAANPAQIRSVIDRVATGQLRDVEEISAALGE
jgi:RHS repeat-associated protein